MKKGMLVCLAVVVSLALAVPSLAVDWSASGYICVTGNVFKNTDAPVDPDHFDENGAYMSMRNRLKIKAKASKDLYGVMYFEIDSGRFGIDDGTRNHAGYWGADRTAVEVKNVYIDFKIPQIPIWSRLGVQGYKIRPDVFLVQDGAGASMRVKIDPIKMTITGMYGKMRDTDFWEANEGAEIYALDMNLPIGPVKVGGYFTYEDVRTDADVPANMDSLGLWWLGAYMDGKFGPIKTEFDFIYNGGEAKADPGFQDIDYNSWLVRGILSFIWNKLEVGLGGMYVHGDDLNDPDNSTFQLPGLTSDAPGINSDTVVFINGWMGTDPGSQAVGMIGSGATWPGFWYVRVFGYYQITDWLKVGAQFAAIGDTVEDGDLFDTAANADDDDMVGYELDAGVNIDIYKNLSFRGAFGYMIADDALRALNNKTGLREDPDDPWVLVGTLLYTF